MKKEVYGDLKIFKFPEHIETVGTDRILAPIHVRIKPTNACSHKCWFCAYAAKDLKLGESMQVVDRIPKSKMIEICQDLVEMGTKSVTFSGGGEPLSYSHILDAILELKKGDIHIGAITNGRFLEGKIAKAFASHSTWVRISIDAWDGESLKKARSVSLNEFDKIIDNIESFLKLKSSCTLGISFIVTKENSSKIYDSVQLFHNLGVHHIKISPCIISNSGEENNKYHAPFYQKVLEQIKMAESKFNSKHFTIINHYHQSEVNFEKDYSFCPYLKFLTIIGADSKVYTCQDKAYTKSGELGDLSKKSFKEFWFSKENKEMMNKVNPSKSCSHHCVTNKKNKALLNFTSIDSEHGSFV